MTARSGSEAAAPPAASASPLPASRASRRLRAPLLPSLLLLSAAVLLAGGLAVSLGPVNVPLLTVWRVLLHRLLGLNTGALSGGTEAIIWQIRLPRVVLAGMVGATLACSGATYQGVFRNPLAEPYLIGVASGAGLGAALSIVTPLHASWHGLGTAPLFAFAGAMAAVAISYGAARSGSGAPAATLILAGVAVSTLASSAMSFLFLQHNERFLTILSWLLGGFNTASWSACALVLPYVALTVATVLGFGRVLNVLQFGEEQAQQLGLPVERVKLILLLAASLGAAAAVSVSGLIGFVGLIVPHAVRLIWGPDYRRLLPLSLLAGATFLILADAVARMALRPQEVPIGVITAFCGAPFFLFLLRRRLRAAP